MEYGHMVWERESLPAVNLHLAPGVGCVAGSSLLLALGVGIVAREQTKIGWASYCHTKSKTFKTIALRISLAAWTERNEYKLVSRTWCRLCCHFSQLLLALGVGCVARELLQ